MSKTIEQLRAQASQIEEASRQGENTQLRVGGLFTDIIDFIGQIPVTETILGPLLRALNNSELIDPTDGQTLVFSLMKDGWTFSDALSQLKISQNEISSTVTSNYEAFLRVKDEFEQDWNELDDRFNTYNTEFASYRKQTNSYIGQFVAAFTADGRIVSMTEVLQTAADIKQTATDNKNASDKAFKKLFVLSGLDFDDEDQDYSASWLYQNKEGISGAAATFDEEGNILASSVLQTTVDGLKLDIKKDVDDKFASLKVTIDGLELKVKDVDDKYALLKATVDGIEAGVGKDEKDIENLKNVLDGYTDESGVYHNGLIDRLGIAESGISGYADSASWIRANRDRIVAVTGYFDADGKLLSTAGLVTKGDYAGLFAEYYGKTGAATKMAEMSVSLESKVDKDGVERIISNAKIDADNINFNFNNEWRVTSRNGTTPVMRMDTNGNLSITGNINANSVLDFGSKINGINTGCMSFNLKTQYITIPSGSTDASSYITWDGGSNIILTGTHSSGNINMYLPTHNNISNVLGRPTSERFVVEINFLNLSNYTYLYLQYSTDTGTGTSYPRRMNHDNFAYSGDAARIQLAVGDLYKILLVYTGRDTGNYYNAYELIERI